MAIHEKTNTVAFKVIVFILRNNVCLLKTGISQQSAWSMAKF